MADPLSFVASIVAVAALAGNVVTKGYQYIKAVKNCQDDVRNLIVEVNVLCGILDRLAVLLRAEAQESKKNVILDSDSEAVELEAPGFVWKCRKTLTRIENILNKFGREEPISPESANKLSRFSLSRLRQLKANNLKWPLTRSETLQLIGVLERHKSTCTLALAKDGLFGVHAILDEVQISNKYLAELRAKQEQLIELKITEIEEKALSWLSPVNPAYKFQAFKRERQQGTGTWLFDLAEMSYWRENKNSALWVYGIPGSGRSSALFFVIFLALALAPVSAWRERAGKTILSTVVIDEVLSRKRNTSVGTAYFYIRHDDKDSHRLSSVLGSIISQLARQSPPALADMMRIYSAHTSRHSLATSLDDDDLIEQIHNLSRFFTETYIVVDGLDECGPTLDSGRKCLINALAELHDDEEHSIRILIFSRDEDDIRTRLVGSGFESVSIAARSADLHLYVTSWIPSLDIRDETLKVDVIETLVKQADGMFMWIRAQIDYLKRLPNDIEKRKALGQLPPDLPQTYIRIFETIESNYPVQTRTFIQRALKWLVFEDELRSQDSLLIYTCTVDCIFDSYVLCQAICIEDEYNWPPAEAMTTEMQIIRWLGCLIYDTGERIELSHFTVKEFLKLNAEKVLSSCVHKYLVAPGHQECITSCLKYMTHEHFRHTTLSTREEARHFSRENPLYVYLALHFCEILDNSNSCGLGGDLDYLLQRIFTITPSPFFQLWDRTNTWQGLDSLMDVERPPIRPARNFESPLQLASYAGLVNQVKILLKMGADPNIMDSSLNCIFLPLHLAICNGHFNTTYVFSGGVNIQLDITNPIPDPTSRRPQKRCLEVTRMLIKSGADTNRQLLVKLYEITQKAFITPLVLAALCDSCEIADLLLSKGAKWDAKSDDTSGDATDLCSIKTLVERIPRVEEIVQRIATLSGHPRLQEFSKKWIKPRGINNIRQSIRNGASDYTNSQDFFVSAYRREEWETVRDCLDEFVDIDINGYDEHGTNAVACASTASSDVLLDPLNRRGDPCRTGPNVLCALALAIQHDCIKNMNLLLDFGAQVDQPLIYYGTPFLFAVHYKRYEAMRILLDAGADINATSDNGSNALCFKNSNEDQALWAFLLNAGVDPNMPDNYGTRALHHACRIGPYSKVKKLIDLDNEAADTVNQNSVNYGCPLYIAATWGWYQIVELLLDSGAIIDQVGLGNMLGSALMVACAYGHRDVVQLLLSRGAALEVEGSRFLSAAGTAQAFRKTAILEILEEHSNRSEAGNNEDQVEGARDDISENVQYDQGISDEPEEEAEASSTASFSEEDDDLNETQESKKSWTDTVVVPNPREPSRQDA